MAIHSAQEADLIAKIRGIHQAVIKTMPDHRVEEELAELAVKADPDDVVDQVVLSEYAAAAARRGLVSNPPTGEAAGEDIRRRLDGLMPTPTKRGGGWVPLRKLHSHSFGEYNRATFDDAVRPLVDEGEFELHGGGTQIRRTQRMKFQANPKRRRKNPVDKEEAKKRGVKIGEKFVKKGGYHKKGTHLVGAAVRDFVEKETGLKIKGAKYGRSPEEDYAIILSERAKGTVYQLTGTHEFSRMEDVFPKKKGLLSKLMGNPKGKKVPALDKLGIYYELAKGGPGRGALQFYDDWSREVRVYEYDDGTWWWQRFDTMGLEDENTDGKTFERAVREATVEPNPKKKVKRIVTGKFPKGLSKTLAKRRAKAQKNPIKHTLPRTPRTIRRGHKSTWTDVWGDGSEFGKAFYGQNWTVRITQDDKGHEVTFGPSGFEEEREWLYFSGTGDGDTPEILEAVEERIKNLSKNPCIGLHFHGDDAEALLEAAEKANKRQGNPPKKKKTLKGRAERAEKKIAAAGRRAGKRIKKDVKKAGKDVKKFGKTKTGYTTAGAGAGALLLGPVGAVAGAVGGSKLFDNPGKEQHHSRADRKWNMFEDAWGSYTISNSPEDLLAAYTAAVEAELHYAHAGVENEDGRGYGPAGAEAAGIRSTIFERLEG
jgi:hypothetical protein